jgi:hypothetical protein
MTRSTERSSPTGESTARTSTVFIVAKDPAMHFGDTKPVFAGHGAVLLEVEGQEFFEHLKELLAEEHSELVDHLVPFSAVELKPAVMVRVRKELGRTEDVAANLGGITDSTFTRIGCTSLKLKEHAEDLRAVLPEMMKSSEKRLACLCRHAQIVRECWTLLNDVSSCSSSWTIHVPHPLTQEIEAISLLLEQSLPELAECDLFKEGKNGIDGMIDSITCVDPDAKDIMTEYLFGSIQSAEQFIARLKIRFGDGRNCLTAKDKDALETTRKSIATYAKRRERANKQSSKKQTPGSDALTELLGKMSGAVKPAAAPAAPKPQASATATQPAVAKPEAEPVPEPDGLRIDAERMTVHCNGKKVTLDGQKHRRFKLLQLLLDQPDVPLSHRLLCASGNPWMENRSHKISVSAIKSIVRELKKDLKPLGVLPVVIKTQSFEGELRPVLKPK